MNSSEMDFYDSLLIENCANSDQIGEFSPLHSPFDFNCQCIVLTPTDPVMTDFS